MNVSPFTGEREKGLGEQLCYKYHPGNIYELHGFKYSSKGQMFPH